jgi:hypothetical protein
MLLQEAQVLVVLGTASADAAAELSTDMNCAASCVRLLCLPASSVPALANCC